MLQERLLAKRLIRTLLRQLSLLFRCSRQSTHQHAGSLHHQQIQAYVAPLCLFRTAFKRGDAKQAAIPPRSAHSSLGQIPTTFLSFTKCVGFSTFARDTRFHIHATWPFPVKQPRQTLVYALSRNPPTHFAHLLMPGVHPITFRAPSTPGNAVDGTRIRPWLARFPVCQFGKKRDNQPKKGAYHE